MYDIGYLCIQYYNRYLKYYKKVSSILKVLSERAHNLEIYSRRC